MNMCGTLIILSILALMAVVPIITQYSHLLAFFPMCVVCSVYERRIEPLPSQSLL